VVPFKARDEAFAALEEGKVDAFASDKLLLLGAASKSKDRVRSDWSRKNCRSSPTASSCRGRFAFRLAVNTGLAQIYGSGEIARYSAAGSSSWASRR